MGHCAAILTEARRLVADKGLTKRPYAVDSYGADVEPISPYAVAYSVLGAIKCALGLSIVEFDSNMVTIGKCLQRAHTKNNCYHEWSRDQFTSVEEVLSLFDRAIDYAEVFDL